MGYIFAFGRQHHECYAKHGVAARGENLYFLIAADQSEKHLCAFRSANPILLRLFQRFCPIEAVKSIEQALGIGRHAQAPLTHDALFDGIAAAYRQTFAHFVVGQYATQLRAPIHFRVGQIGNAVVHQYLLLTAFVPTFPFVGREYGRLALCRPHFGVALIVEYIYQHRNGTCGVGAFAVPVVEHLHKSPLCPMIKLRVAGAHLAAPIVAETDFVQLLAVTRYVFAGRYFGVLTGLNGVLLGRQTVGIIAHRMQHVVASQTFVAAENVAGDVSQRMSDVQTRARRIRKHVQNVIFWTRRVGLGLIHSVVNPILLPLLLDLFEIVFHDLLRCYKKSANIRNFLEFAITFRGAFA